jgi:predicted transcriptional regulator
MTTENNEEKISLAARDLIRIEKKCFYGQEQERDRLKKMRELIDQVAKEIPGDN